MKIKFKLLVKERLSVVEDLLLDLIRYHLSIESDDNDNNICVLSKYILSKI